MALVVSYSKLKSAICGDTRDYCHVTLIQNRMQHMSLRDEHPMKTMPSIFRFKFCISGCRHFCIYEQFTHLQMRQLSSMHMLMHYNQHYSMGYRLAWCKASGWGSFMVSQFAHVRFSCGLGNFLLQLIKQMEAKFLWLYLLSSLVGCKLILYPHFYFLSIFVTA